MPAGIWVPVHVLGFDALQSCCVYHQVLRIYCLNLIFRVISTNSSIIRSGRIPVQLQLLTSALRSIRIASNASASLWDCIAIMVCWISQTSCLSWGSRIFKSITEMYVNSWLSPYLPDQAHWQLRTTAFYTTNLAALFYEKFAKTYWASVQFLLPLLALICSILATLKKSLIFWPCNKGSPSRIWLWFHWVVAVDTPWELFSSA